jgi:pimeloyl-ACP methyl ester carboxylesterase
MRLPDTEMLDRLPDDPAWGHARVAGSGGVTLHYVRLGQGRPVLLLHGWPGFWYDWRRVLVPLSATADVIAPDFRGFGDSDRPDLPPLEGYTPEILADDLLALLDGLGITRVVVAAYDIGATVAQNLAIRRPERIRALALFNPTYPGIGARRSDPSVQREFWYQHFHALAWSDRLIAHDRETVSGSSKRSLMPTRGPERSGRASPTTGHALRRDGLGLPTLTGSLTSSSPP